MLQSEGQRIILDAQETLLMRARAGKIDWSSCADACEVLLGCFRYEPRIPRIVQLTLDVQLQKMRWIQPPPRDLFWYNRFLASDENIRIKMG